MYLQKKKTYLLIILFSAVTSAANAQPAATDSVETETAQTAEKKPWFGKRLVNKLNTKYFTTTVTRYWNER